MMNRRDFLKKAVSLPLVAAIPSLVLADNPVKVKYEQEDTSTWMQEWPYLRSETRYFLERDSYVTRYEVITRENGNIAQYGVDFMHSGNKADKKDQEIALKVLLKDVSGKNLISWDSLPKKLII